MKSWRCDHCGRRRRSEDDVIIYICPACMEQMVEVTRKKNETEIKRGVKNEY